MEINLPGRDGVIFVPVHVSSRDLWVDVYMILWCVVKTRCFEKRMLVPPGNPMICHQASPKAHLNAVHCCKDADFCNQAPPTLAPAPTTVASMFLIVSSFCCVICDVRLLSFREGMGDVRHLMTVDFDLLWQKCNKLLNLYGYCRLHCNNQLMFSVWNNDEPSNLYFSDVG